MITFRETTRNDEIGLPRNFLTLQFTSSLETFKNENSVDMR